MDRLVLIPLFALLFVLPGLVLNVALRMIARLYDPVENWGEGADSDGRAPSGQALVASDGAASRLHPPGFDPSRNFPFHPSGDAE